MNDSRNNADWLLWLEATRQLEAEAALRTVLLQLEQARIACTVVARPDLDNIELRERQGPDAVLQVAPDALGRAATVLKQAGWHMKRPWLLLGGATGTVRFARAGLTLELRHERSGQQAGEGRQSEPSWSDRYRALRDELRGWRRFSFMDLNMKVHAGVFRPGIWSINIVQSVWWEIEDIAHPIVIDVGTGTGAIALAVAAGRGDARVLGIDISRAAVRNARSNARHLHISNAHFQTGELLAPVSAEWTGQVRVIAANLPWIPGAICAHAALTGVAWRGPEWSVHGAGTDGLDLQRRLARDAWPLLQRGGALVLEVDDWQAALLLPELGLAGYEASEEMPGLIVAHKPDDATDRAPAA